MPQDGSGSLAYNNPSSSCFEFCALGSWTEVAAYNIQRGLRVV
jgi:hypothetical protein